MVIRPMDLATGGKYMYRRQAELAVGYGFWGSFGLRKQQAGPAAQELL